MEIKQERISKHTDMFCGFIESVDFELLLQNEQYIDLSKRSM